MQGGFLGKFLCLLLGIIIGLGSAVGGVVGAGYYIGSLPINEAATTIDGLAGTNLSDVLFGSDDKAGLLADSYADKYVKDLLSDATAAISSLTNGGSLAELNNISPKIKELVDKLVKTTDKYGIPLESDKLLNKPIKAAGGEEGLTDYFIGALKGTSLGKMLTGLGEAPEGLLLYLCYGEEGTDYVKDGDEIVMLEGKTETTVQDLLGGDLTTLFDKVPLSAVTTPVVGDSPMLTIAYGREGITYIINNPEATDAEADVTMLPMFYEIKGGQVLDYSGAVVEGTLLSTSDEAGYKQFQLATAEGEPISYIYLKTPVAPETKYYAYQKIDGTLKEMTFPKTKISDLTKDSMGVIDKILLKDVLSGSDDKTNAVLESLCYDKDGNPNSIGQLRNQGGALVDSIPLDTIMTPDDSAVVLYLLYGHEGIHFEKKVVGEKTQYEMLQQFIAIYNGEVYNEYGEKLAASSYTLNTSAKTYSVTVGEETITYSYVESATDKVTLPDMPALIDVNGDGIVDSKDKQDVSVYRNYLFDENGEKVMFEETVLGDFARSHNKLDTITDHLTVADIFGDDIAGNSILSALADSRIGNIGEDVKHVPISALFSEEDLNGNQLLKSLSDSTLDTLSDDINGLTMAGILGEDKVMSNSILKNLANETIITLPDAINDLTVEQVLHDQIYYYNAEGKYYTDKNGVAADKLLSDGTINPVVINATWKYLLKERADGRIHTEYKITQDMNHLIENMKANVHDATLNDLYEDELIDKASLDSATLNSQLRFSVAGVGLAQTNFTDKMKDAANNGTTLLIGDCTVQEMLVYISALLHVVA